MNKKFVTKKFILKSLIALLCLIGFIVLAEKVFNQEIMQMDIKGYALISKYLISNYVTPIARLITNLGGTIVLISLALALLIILKNKKIGISICYNLVFIALLNVILKSIVARPRPVGLEIINESGYSFPSGHSMVSAAFYGYLIYLIYNHLENKKIKWTLIVSLSILIIMIGLSRIYLGVHYLSDVIAGFLISMSYLVVYSSIAKKYIGGNNEIIK